MSYVLLGLQYCAGAFMIVLIAIVGMLFVMWGFRLIYGQQMQSGDTGAVEGNDRLPPIGRFRPADDDHLWDDV